MRTIVALLVICLGLFAQVNSNSVEEVIRRIKISSGFDAKSLEGVNYAIYLLGGALEQPIEVEDLATNRTLKMELSSLESVTYVPLPLDLKESQDVVFLSGTTIQIGQKAPTTPFKLAAKLVHQLARLQLGLETVDKMTPSQRRESHILAAGAALNVHERLSIVLSSQQKELDPSLFTQVQGELDQVFKEETKYMQYFQLLGDLMELRGACNWLILNIDSFSLDPDPPKVFGQIKETLEMAESAIAPLANPSSGTINVRIDTPAINESYNVVKRLAEELLRSDNPNFKQEAAKLLSMLPRWRIQLRNFNDPVEVPRLEVIKPKVAAPRRTDF